MNQKNRQEIQISFNISGNVTQKDDQKYNVNTVSLQWTRKMISKTLLDYKTTFGWVIYLKVLSWKQQSNLTACKLLKFSFKYYNNWNRNDIVNES